MSDEQEPPKPPPPRGLRSVGDALGGWARRVGELVAEVSGTPSVPDELREPLQHARTLRLSGQISQAQAVLRGQLEAPRPMTRPNSTPVTSWPSTSPVPTRVNAK